MAAQQTARKQSRSKRDKKPEDEATQYEQELASYLQERIKPGLNKGSIPLLARSIAKELASRQRPDGASEEPEEQDEADVEPTDEAEDEPRDEDGDDHDDEPRDEAVDEDEEDLDDEPRDEVVDEDEEDLDDEPRDEAVDEEDLGDEAEDEDLEDEPDDEEDDVSQETEQKPDFEADMRELQAELGDEWVLTFSVKGDDAWLTAEKEDGSQHVEAQTADLLLEAVELLEEGGGRSG